MADFPDIYIPFGDMAPDAGMIARGEGDEHLLMALSVWPHGVAGYLPAGDLAESGFGQTPAGQPTGSALFDQQYLYYGNTEGEIYEANYSALSVVKRHTLVSGGVDWSMVRFGDSMIATNYKDPLLAQSTRGSDFADLITAGALAPVDAQDETSYDNSPTTEGTFAGGTGHAASDVITLADGTTVTVDAVAAGVVTQFTVDSSGSNGISVAVGVALVQSSTTGSGTGFSLTPDTDNVTQLLRGKYVETFRERVVVGNLETKGTTALGSADTFPYTIWWSGQQAANNFDATDAALRSGFQTLPTKWGVITGLAETGDVLLIFLERAVYRMSPVDGVLPFAFEFEPVVEGIGTIHPRSIVSYGGAAYFWGPSGPAMVYPGGYSELGADRMTSTLQSGRWPISVELDLDRTLDVADIIGCLSPSSSSILWRYPPADSAYNDLIVAWNFRTGRWSVPGVFRKNASDPSINNEIRFMEDRADVYAEAWEIGSTLALGSFDGINTTLKSFSTDIQAGENGTSAFVAAPRWQLAYRSLSAHAAPTHVMILATPTAGSSWGTPDADGKFPSPPVLGVTVRAKDNPLWIATDDGVVEATITSYTDEQTPATGGDAPFDESGWLSIQTDSGGVAVTPQRAGYHQFEITLTPSSTCRFSEIQGIYVRVAGTAGGAW